MSTTIKRPRPRMDYLSYANEVLNCRDLAKAALRACPRWPGGGVLNEATSNVLRERLSYDLDASQCGVDFVATADDFERRVQECVKTVRVAIDEGDESTPPYREVQIEPQFIVADMTEWFAADETAELETERWKRGAWVTVGGKPGRAFIDIELVAKPVSREEVAGRVLVTWEVEEAE